MKINRLVSAILMGTSFISINVHAGFDWGGESGECAGDGTFQQPIAKDAVVEVGEIPAGKEGVYIELKSYKDIDIQLYDRATGYPIVKWPDGDLNKNYNQSTTYAGSRIEWSGYNGDCQFFNGDYSVCEAGTSPGNEYIKIDLTQTPLTMKAFGYDSGEARVNYSWEGTVGCDRNGPAESGSGTFQQQIAYKDIVEVGNIIPGLTDVYIELISDEDVDIQLYDGNIKIVHWPSGILNSSNYQSTNYGGMTIEWSGYNGDGRGLGHEYIRITGEVDRTLTMKAYGYKAGYATVNYYWGHKNSFGVNSLDIKKQPLLNTWKVSGSLYDGVKLLVNKSLGVYDGVKSYSTTIITNSNGHFEYLVSIPSNYTGDGLVKFVYSGKIVGVAYIPYSTGGYSTSSTSTVVPEHLGNSNYINKDFIKTWIAYSAEEAFGGELPTEGILLNVGLSCYPYIIVGTVIGGALPVAMGAKAGAVISIPVAVAVAPSGVGSVAAVGKGVIVGSAMTIPFSSFGAKVGGTAVTSACVGTKVGIHLGKAASKGYVHALYKHGEIDKSTHDAVILLIDSYNFTQSINELRSANAFDGNSISNLLTINKIMSDKLKELLGDLLPLP